MSSHDARPDSVCGYLTLRYDDVDLPLVCRAECLVDRVAAAEDLGLVVALRVVFADRPDVLLQVVAEREPDGGDLLLEDGRDAGVLGRLGHVEDPAEQADADGEGGVLGDLEGLACRAQSVPQLLGRVEACGSC